MREVIDLSKQSFNCYASYVACLFRAEFKKEKDFADEIGIIVSNPDGSFGLMYPTLFILSNRYSYGEDSMNNLGQILLQNQWRIFEFTDYVEMYVILAKALDYRRNYKNLRPLFIPQEPQESTLSTRNIIFNL